MGAADWNFKLASDVQDYPWDCSAASLAWALRAWGLDMSEQDVIAGLGPYRVNPVHGLLDASGAGLVEYLGELGISAAYNSQASWSDTLAAAGHQPMVMGGRRWCHWTAVRMGTWAAGYLNTDALWLMNPAPGYMGVDQYLEEADYLELGAFSVVWFPA